MALQATHRNSSRRRTRRKRSLHPRAVLPSNLAVLELLTIEVSVVDDGHFLITCQPKNTLPREDQAATLSAELYNFNHCQQRTFQELCEFQQRLLTAMEQGHFCKSECPWFFSFLTNYFPKKHLLPFIRSRTVEKRREALALCFAKTQEFLLDRNNRSCSIVTGPVADIFMGFLLGRYSSADGYYVELLTSTTLFTEEDEQCRTSTDSFTSLSSVEDEESKTCCQFDGLELSRLSEKEEKVYRLSSCSTVSSVCSTTRFSSTDSLSYISIPSCDHQFHDE